MIFYKKKTQKSLKRGRCVFSYTKVLKVVYMLIVNICCT